LLNQAKLTILYKMRLTERLKVIAYQLVKDAEGQVTKKHHNTMISYVKNLYYNASPESKLKMQSEWTEQGI